VAQTAMFALTVLDMSDFPTRHPYGLGIWQNQIERIMAAWIAELPVRIYYGCEVTGCPTRGSTELETPATRPTTAVRRGTAAPEVSR
jgi:2-polyprenyl-6-methoxyphenol hydroxylase-like FAD-dependent oxidoreductase